MDVAAFERSLSQTAPPRGISEYLAALWFDAAGDWQQAHELIQALDDEKASWIHAYLHRKEGDDANAGYWYRRAGRSPHEGAHDQEWRELVQVLLTA